MGRFCLAMLLCNGHRQFLHAIDERRSVVDAFVIDSLHRHDRVEQIAVVRYLDDKTELDRVSDGSPFRIRGCNLAQLVPSASGHAVVMWGLDEGLSRQLGRNSREVQQLHVSPLRQVLMELCSPIRVLPILGCRRFVP